MLAELSPAVVIISAEHVQAVGAGRSTLVPVRLTPSQMYRNSGAAKISERGGVRYE
jgi:hypothetical protein